jgi:hypothetical protein
MYAEDANQRIMWAGNNADCTVSAGVEADTAGNLVNQETNCLMHIINQCHFASGTLSGADSCPYVSAVTVSPHRPNHQELVTISVTVADPDGDTIDVDIESTTPANMNGVYTPAGKTITAVANGAVAQFTYTSAMDGMGTFAPPGDSGVRTFTLDVTNGNCASPRPQVQLTDFIDITPLGDVDVFGQLTGGDMHYVKDLTATEPAIQNAGDTFTFQADYCTGYHARAVVGTITNTDGGGTACTSLSAALECQSDGGAFAATCDDVLADTCGTRVFRVTYANDGAATCQIGVVFGDETVSAVYSHIAALDTSDSIMYKPRFRFGSANAVDPQGGTYEIAVQYDEYVNGGSDGDTVTLYWLLMDSGASDPTDLTLHWTDDSAGDTACLASGICTDGTLTLGFAQSTAAPNGLQKNLEFDHVDTSRGKVLVSACPTTNPTISECSHLVFEIKDNAVITPPPTPASRRLLRGDSEHYMDTHAALMGTHVALMGSGRHLTAAEGSSPFLIPVHIQTYDNTANFDTFIPVGETVTVTPTANGTVTVKVEDSSGMPLYLIGGVLFFLLVAYIIRSMTSTAHRYTRQCDDPSPRHDRSRRGAGFGGTLFAGVLQRTRTQDHFHPNVNFAQRGSV